MLNAVIAEHPVGKHLGVPPISFSSAQDDKLSKLGVWNMGRVILHGESAASTLGLIGSAAFIGGTALWIGLKDPQDFPLRNFFMICLFGIAIYNFIRSYLISGWKWIIRSFILTIISAGIFWAIFYFIEK